MKAEIVIKELLGRGIEFYDYRKLDKGSWRTYHNDAQLIANNETFTNELKHYITDLVKFLAYEADTLDKVLHTRTAIVALETFKDRLLQIEDPTTRNTNNNPNDPL